MAALSVTAVATARLALACSESPAPLAAFPASGATDVPPASSIVVVGRRGVPPLGLSLQAAGTPVFLLPTQSLGVGRASEMLAEFYRLPGPLEPGTAYVLWFTDPQSMVPPRELTRFTTAAAPAADQPAGTPARLDRLRLWRVRYPVAEISRGGCVFDEYHGYIRVSYQDGTVPGTPPAEVINTLSLVPENGTVAQTFVFTGGPFTGVFPGNPDGEVPSPSSATWRPELAPDRRYCLTLQQQGRNDLAVPPLRSNTLCAEVMNVDLSGGNADGGVDARAGVPTDAEQSGGGIVERARRGCSVASAGSGEAGGWPLLVAALALVAGRRRRSGARRAQR